MLIEFCLSMFLALIVVSGGAKLISHEWKKLHCEFEAFSRARATLSERRGDAVGVGSCGARVRLLDLEEVRW